MLVDKCGRNGDRAKPIYTGINIANFTNSFLRRDGGNTEIGTIYMNSRFNKYFSKQIGGGANTAIGTIDMNIHFIKNVANPLSNQDVATKNYVDKNAITTDGGVV